MCVNCYLLLRESTISQLLVTDIRVIWWICVRHIYRYFSIRCPSGNLVLYSSLIRHYNTRIQVSKHHIISIINIWTDAWLLSLYSDFCLATNSVQTQVRPTVIARIKSSLDCWVALYYVIVSFCVSELCDTIIYYSPDWLSLASTIQDELMTCKLSIYIEPPPSVVIIIQR